MNSIIWREKTQVVMISDKRLVSNYIHEFMKLIVVALIQFIIYRGYKVLIESSYRIIHSSRGCILASKVIPHRLAKVQRTCTSEGSRKACAINMKKAVSLH